MKLVIIIADGLADWCYPELGDRSPVEYAHTPGIDEIVRRGQVGLAQTLYEGLPLGSLVGMLGILGYRPPDYFPLGRSIFEGRVLGLKFSPEDMVFRCNIVRVDEAGVLADFTAGQIDDAAANRYLNSVSLPPELEIHHDLSYRNVLIYRNCSLDETALQLSEPHEHVGQRIADLLPHYRGEVYQPFADLLLQSRRDGLMLWLWGAGRAKDFPPMPYRMVTVTALSFLSGMAQSLGGVGIIPPGTTGYIGSNLTAKLETALSRLPETDVCLIHCNAPDEEAHVKNVRGKIKAIEEIDQWVVSPMLNHLDNLGEPYRVWFLPDHYTVCGTGKHLPDHVPYAICGTGLSPDHSLTGYSEREIGEASRSKPIQESYRFIPTLLKS